MMLSVITSSLPAMISDNATLVELVPWREGVANMSREVVGRTLVKLEGDRNVCRMKECNMGRSVV